MMAAGYVAIEAPQRRRRWAVIAAVSSLAGLAGAAAALGRGAPADDFTMELVDGGAWGEKLYECKNGEPSVPRAYRKHAWGSIEGDWYIIAGNVPRSDNAIGRCAQMKFELPDAGASVMNQNMMYISDKTDYWWNYTGNYQLEDHTGVWKNEDGDGTNENMYKRFWSSVFAVGTYKGERWFGWYFCGPAVEITRRGIPWILKETYEYDDAFEKVVKKAMVEAGVLEYGDFYTYVQSSDCDYVWFHEADDVESIQGALTAALWDRNATAAGGGVAP